MRINLKTFFLGVLVAIFLISCQWFHSSRNSDNIDITEVAELEEYLIDFSKKMEGYKLSNGPLPLNLDAEKFFDLLLQYYPDEKFIQKVREYPVRVLPLNESYVLILCDKQSQLILYKDLGKTIDHVDYPYWRQKKKVPCQ